MAATGYTPISLYYSTTAAAVPVNTNLVNGELAINITDGKLYYKDNTGTVQLLAGKGGAGVAAGSNTQIQYNNAGAFGASAGFTYTSGTSTLTVPTAIFSGTGAVTLPVGTTGQQPGTPTVGMIRYNSTTNGFEGYAGSSPAWGSIGGGGAPATTDFTATAGQTVFTLSYTVGNLEVYRNGIKLGIADFTATNGTSFTLATGALVGDLIEAVQFTGATTPGAVSSISVGSNLTASGATGAVTLNLAASPSVTSLTSSADVTLSGLTVGKGAGSIGTNTALGAGSLASNTTGSGNTGLGYLTLNANLTGTNNIAIGLQAGSNITGSSNVAIGVVSLSAAGNTGSNNTAVGHQSLNNNTTASNNTAVGYQAGYSNVTGGGNVFIGSGAGYNSTNNENCFVGTGAGNAVTTGSGNTFVGRGNSTAAGTTMTTGNQNTILGGFSGNQNGLDIRTSSNYIVLSDGAGTPTAYWNNNGMLVSTASGNAAGQSAQFFNNAATTSNQYGIYNQLTGDPNNNTQWFMNCVGNATGRITLYSNGGIGNFQGNNVNFSDATLKKDIELAPNYLDKLCQIPVKTFLFKDQTDTNLNLGVIAQDVQEIAPELVSEINSGTTENPNIVLGIYETDLKYAMLKAIQEQQAIITQQAADIAALKAKVGI